MRVLVVIVAILLAFSAVTYATRNIFVQNNKMYVNEQEFIVKGMDYSPGPIGEKGTNLGTGYGGTGFCSAKLTPWNEWKSACYDSDFYDGSTDVDPTRFPQGFLPLWQRDFPQIKSTGANTLRLYNTNPSTRAATQIYTNLFTAPTGKDHTQFMTLCEQYGFMVIFPLFTDNWSYANYDEVTMKRYLRWQIDEVGNSSALLMFQFGNEADWTWPGGSNTWNSPAATNKFNRYCDYIRRYTLSKWKRNIPVTAAIANIQGNYNFQYQNWHVDIFSANVFGTSFGNLFSGVDSNFFGVKNLSCITNKPFLITECGPTYKTGQVYNPGDFNQIWSNVAANMNDGLLGAVYFEHSDEPALGKDFGMFALSVTVTAVANSTQPNVFIPDTLVPKRQYYDVKGGTYNGGQYNMNSNMFSLINRTPSTLANSADPTCGSSYKACPGSGNPKCSGNGICNRLIGACSCGDGWAGTDCSIAVCPGSGCSGRGACSALVSPPECFCNAGYFGSTCQNAVSSVPAGQCPGGCTEGNGVCNTATGVCACWPGWIGPDCAVTYLGGAYPNGTSSNSITPYYSGCVKLSRTSSAVAGPVSSTMTNQKCRYYCALRDYDYSETRGQNCYCLSQANEAAAPVYADSSCTTSCGGDSSQKCGGTSGYSSYIAGDAAKTGYLGCYVDTGARDLPNNVFEGQTITVDSCRQLCGSKGYTYAGMQAGYQCFCGNTFGNQGGLADDSQCGSTCGGDTGTLCGGSWRNSIYTSSLSAGYAFL